MDSYRLKVLSRYASGRTLDIGYAQCPNPYLQYAYGIDIEHCKVDAKNYIKKDIIKPDEYKYPYRSGFFDSVIAGEVIEHIPNLHDFLIGIRRILKNDGILLISCPNPASPVEVLVHIWKYISGVDYKLGKKGEHCHSFLFTNMITLLNNYGFDVHRIEGSHIQIPFTDIKIPCRFVPLAYQTIYICSKRKV